MTECKAHLDKIMMSPHISRLVSVHVQHVRSIPSNQHTSGPPHSASGLITFTLLTISNETTTTNLNTPKLLNILLCFLKENKKFFIFLFYILTIILRSHI